MRTWFLWAELAWLLLAITYLYILHAFLRHHQKYAPLAIQRQTFLTTAESFASIFVGTFFSKFWSFFLLMTVRHKPLCASAIRYRWARPLDETTLCDLIFLFPIPIVHDELLYNSRTLCVFWCQQLINDGFFCWFFLLFEDSWNFLIGWVVFARTVGPLLHAVYSHHCKGWAVVYLAEPVLNVSYIDVFQG